jgi:hypothetical protein
MAILQAELEISELHLDEDTFMMYGREGGRFVDLVDEKRLDDYHILDRSTLQLKVSFSNCFKPWRVPICYCIPDEYNDGSDIRE